LRTNGYGGGCKNGRDDEERHCERSEASSSKMKIKKTIASAICLTAAMIAITSVPTLAIACYPAPSCCSLRQSIKKLKRALDMRISRLPSISGIDAKDQVSASNVADQHPIYKKKIFQQ
jgi:hypothetical protein